MATTPTQVVEPTWPQILGRNNWENLLHPLNLTLRQLILRCGDFCQATYDAFNSDKNSKYCGTSRYGKTNFFHKVMLENADNYRVASFLYGTARVSLPEAFFIHHLSRESWDRETNWIGYIAVTSDEHTKAIGRREIYVAFRGTTTAYEWVNIFGAKLESATSLLKTTPLKFEEGNCGGDSDDDDGGEAPEVMLGWLTIYVSSNPNSAFTKISARAQLLTKIKELIERYRDDNLSIAFAGHSLGASLSILSAFDVVENGIRDIPVAAFVFGSPRVGNNAFNERLKRYPNLNILHIKNKIDAVPHYPARLFGYVDTGTELLIDTRKSPWLKESEDKADWHNLQAMLHIVAGWNGEDGEFEMKVKRSLALVNKSCKFLKDECLVPELWWVEKNKGMIRDENGDWVVAPPDEEDQPVPEV